MAKTFKNTGVALTPWKSEHPLVGHGMPRGDEQRGAVLSDGREVTLRVFDNSDGWTWSLRVRGHTAAMVDYGVVRKAEAKRRAMAALRKLVQP